MIFDQNNIGIIFSSKEKSKALKDNINSVMLVFHTFCKYLYKKEVKIHLSQQKSLRPKSQSIHHSVMATTTVVNVKWINQLVYRHNNASNDQLLPPVKCETWFVKSLITALDLQPTCVFKSIDIITLLPRSLLC